MNYKLSDCKTVLIVVLGIILMVNCLVSKREHFDALDNINSMNSKLDSLMEQEKETRTFCKLLRHDSGNKEQLKKMMEYRNTQFNNNWKKQNKMLADIKKKIIGIKLGKNNKDFTEFNTGRNKSNSALQKRKDIIKAAKNMIKKPPTLNLTVQNNI